jgi:hypothetical protein
VAAAIAKAIMRYGGEEGTAEFTCDEQGRRTGPVGAWTIPIRHTVRSTASERDRG